MITAGIERRNAGRGYAAPTAAKRGHIFHHLAARLKSGPSRYLRESDFFSSL